MRPRIKPPTALISSMLALKASWAGERDNSLRFDAPTTLCRATREACLNKCGAAGVALPSTGKLFRLQACEGKRSLKTTGRQRGVILWESVILMEPWATSTGVLAASNCSWHSLARALLMHPATRARIMLTLAPPTLILPLLSETTLSSLPPAVPPRRKVVAPTDEVLEHFN